MGDCSSLRDLMAANAWRIHHTDSKIRLFVKPGSRFESPLKVHGDVPGF